jgi:hypothetical protein
MCYIGLTEREEMEIFSVINGKAKGLSTSLLDFHDATLATDLAKEGSVASFKYGQVCRRASVVRS